jgi:hypothetical protein
MANFTSQGTQVSIGGTSIFARSASANTSISLEAVRVLGKTAAQGVAPSGPQETTVNIEYYIQSSDPGKNIVDNITANPSAHQGTTIQIGSATITKAYLTSLSVSAEPEGLVTASASFVCYEPGINLNIGSFQSPGGSAQNLQFAHGAGSTADISNPIGFTYEASFEWEPVLIMGSVGKPDAAGYIFNGGTESITVRGAGAGGQVTYCPTTRIASASARSVCGGGGVNYSVNGSLTAADINASVGGFAEGGYTVVKNY